MSPEKKELYRRKHREAEQRRRDRMTPEAKDALYAKLRARRLDPEIKAARSESMRNWKQKQSHEKRKARYLAEREARKNWTAERWEEHNSYYRAWKKAHPENSKASCNKRRARLDSVGGSYTPEEWRLLVQKYNYKCLCCGKREPEIKLSVDHVIPISKGGPNVIQNIQPLCFPCNSRKKAKIIDYRKAA
jgi:5-methylcytosine-specific restriction endonuclease McrA